jgi:DNA polymerase-3 subunit delta
MKIAPAQYNSFCQSIPEPIRSVLFYAESESDITPKLSRFIEQGLNRKISDYQTINAADLLKKEIFLSDLLSNQSLFGPPQPIIIQKASDKLVPLLEEHLSIQGREDIIIVISEAYLKPNSKLRQFYEKEDSLACIACYARTVSEIAQDIQTAFKASGQLIDRAALQLLVDIVAQGKTTTKMEVNKIINYLGDNKEQVTLDDVKACTSMDMDVSIEKIYTAVLKKNWAAFPNLILNLEQESRNENRGCSWID